MECATHEDCIRTRILRAMSYFIRRKEHMMISIHQLQKNTTPAPTINQCMPPAQPCPEQE